MFASPNQAENLFTASTGIWFVHLRGVVVCPKIIERGTLTSYCRQIARKLNTLSQPHVVDRFRRETYRQGKIWQKEIS